MSGERFFALVPTIFIKFKLFFCNDLETVEWDIIIKILLKLWRRKEKNEDEKFWLPYLMPNDNYSRRKNLNLCWLHIYIITFCISFLVWKNVEPFRGSVIWLDFSTFYIEIRGRTELFIYVYQINQGVKCHVINSLDYLKVHSCWF